MREGRQQDRELAMRAIGLCGAARAGGEGVAMQPVSYIFRRILFDQMEITVVTVNRRCTWTYSLKRLALSP
jgi:hypothetical protein